MPNKRSPTEPRPSGSGRNRQLTTALLLSAILSPFAVAQPPPQDKTQDLADRLIRGQSPDEDIMARIIKQMHQVEKRLSAAFDPGPETQRLQQRIVARLDEAIAASIRQGSQSGASPRNMPDKRRHRTRPFSGDPKGSPSPTNDARATAPPAAGDPQQTDRTGPLRNSKRGWGNLPARDRDEILQGIKEKSLERFRKWIERYYRSLAEKDDS